MCLTLQISRARVCVCAQFISICSFMSILLSDDNFFVKIVLACFEDNLESGIFRAPKSMCCSLIDSFEAKKSSVFSPRIVFQVLGIACLSCLHLKL